MHHNRPAAFNAGRYLIAKERYHRRCQLWHAARLACENEDLFRAAWVSIGRAVAEQLRREGLS